MTEQARRAAVTRWADPLFGLALLLTGQRSTAETTTIAVFRRVLSAAPGSSAAPAGSTEIALYTALAQQRLPRWRARRRSTLPPALRRIAPADRLLLGLWVLRSVDGPQLLTILGGSSATLITRLAALLRHATADDRATDAAAPVSQDASAPHVTLERWLEAQLGLNSTPAEHLRVCPDCRAAQAHWRAAQDRLRALLVAATQSQHLTAAGIEALETALASADEQPASWWQQQRFWLPALLAGVGLLLAALIVPWGGQPSAPTATPPSAQALVRDTLAVWGSPPAEGTLHRRVLALNTMLRDPDPVLTDVWLDSRSPAHRVEVRRGKQLVEWQLAEGVTRFTYGGLPSLNSCRWNTGYSGHFERFDDAALAFRLTPEQQQAVRDARLREGAYGTGYRLLQQAADAPDLRSFGTRVEGGTALTVLSFSDDRVAPPQQLLLRIDPETRQLHAAQQVVQAGGQTQVRDLWRLQTQDTPDSGIPNDLPAWKPAKQVERLVDPSCPALKPEYLISLRQLNVQPDTWYLPQTLPPGITSAAIFSQRRQVDVFSPATYDSLVAFDTLYTGPNRWLSIATTNDLLSRRADQSQMLPHGRWWVQLDQQPANQLWHGFVQRSAQDPGFYQTPQLELWGAGWSRTELLAVISSLQTVNLQLWRSQEQTFIDAQPLPEQVRTALLDAAAALTDERQPASYVTTRITMRTQPQPVLPEDPFTLPADARQPAQLNREQWFVSGQDRPRVRDVWRLPGGAIFLAQASDGERVEVYALSEGTRWVGTAQDMPLSFQQADRQLLHSMLGLSRATSFSEQGDMLLLEQTLPKLDENALYPLTWDLFATRPFIEDLPQGNGLLRLWLDRRTRLPVRMELLHNTPDGQETPLHSIVVGERRLLAQPPDPQQLALPPLPDDTLTMDVVANNPAIMRAEDKDSSWTSQSLTWPASIGLSIVNEQPPRPESEQLTDLVTGRSSWYALEAAALWRQTQYKLPDVARPITLTQGPRRTLLHVLRYNRLSPGELWSSSERFPVTISGVERTAWLLTGGKRAALVVDTDRLLLHFSADEATLRGFVLAHLSELRPRQPGP